MKKCSPSDPSMVFPGPGLVIFYTQGMSLNVEVTSKSCGVWKERQCPYSVAAPFKQALGTPILVMVRPPTKHALITYAVNRCSDVIYRKTPFILLWNTCFPGSEYIEWVEYCLFTLSVRFHAHVSCSLEGWFHIPQIMARTCHEGIRTPEPQTA